MDPNDALLTILPSAGEPGAAVARALQLARASGAPLHLCALVYDPAVDLAAARVGQALAAHARNDILRARLFELERQAAALDAGGVTIHCDVRWAADAAEAVIAKALEIGARTVIKEVHRESGFKRALFTPLDGQLLRWLPCELLLVNPQSQPAIRRMAVALDVLAEAPEDDGLNRRILRAALRLAEYFDARLDLVSVFPFLPTYSRALIGMSGLYQQLDAQHREAFEAYCRIHRIPEDRRHRLTGVPALALEQFAERHGVDLLALGSVYRKGWERLLLGSTAESLVQDIDADTLLVKPAWALEALDRALDLKALRERQARLRLDAEAADE